jgi:polyisoprenoid-binding protein YceI
MTRSTVLSAASLLFSLPALAAPTAWTVDPGHSSASFSVRHMVVSNVRGELGKVTGTLTLDKDDVTKSTVEASIDVAAISTRDEKRDGHLKSPDFFDTAKYPTLTFKSTSVAKAGEGKLKVAGTLTLHGVSKPVVLDVEGPSAEVTAWGMTKTGFSASTKLDRQAFGVAFSKVLDNGGAVVGNEVSVQLDLEFNKVEVAPVAAPKK